MDKYTKKPVTIEAEKWDGTRDHAQRLISEVVRAGGTAGYIDSVTTVAGPGRGMTTVGPHIQISTLEGHMRLMPGHWLIQGVEGEFYPCDPDIFEKTYEKGEGQ